MKIFDILPKHEGYSNTYDPKLNPSVFNSFATAAYRFGHTLIQVTVTSAIVSKSTSAI